MTQDKHNPPAFPCVSESSHLQEGMTLRDYYAGQILQGIITAVFGRYDQLDLDVAARDAFRGADAMLAAREQS